MGQAQKCTGGCGKTQDVTIAQKGAPKGAFSFAPPWTCPECKIRIEKERTEKQRMKDATQTGRKDAPDVSFSLVPKRPGGKPLAKPAAAPPQPEESQDVGDLEDDAEPGKQAQG